jgi:hypothetical protein
MSAPLRNYRVALVDSGAYAVWVTAESRRAACALAETLPTDSVTPWPDGDIRRIEVLDEYDIAA